MAGRRGCLMLGDGSNNNNLVRRPVVGPTWLGHWDGEAAGSNPGSGNDLQAPSPCGIGVMGSVFSCFGYDKRRHGGVGVI